MPEAIRLTNPDARRAMAHYQFRRCADIPAAFEQLRSVQFDPIAPAGCNHDLVLRNRMDGYQVGDWQSAAYEKREIYDGWDKQASLLPVSAWPSRRIFHRLHREQFVKVLRDDADTVQKILSEIRERGPLMPKESAHQEQREEWRGSWLGTSLAKKVLRALWHSGQIMTMDRRKGQHVYDLTERVLPAEVLSLPDMSDEDCVRELVLDRHRAMGLVRPTAAMEVWSYFIYAGMRKDAIESLVRAGDLVPVEVEGMLVHATPDFLKCLDLGPAPKTARFIAPLDPFLWDRKMVGQIFGFEYIWEIYTPLAKRRWGYYVLPLLVGDQLVGRAEFVARKGVLSVVQWHQESGFDPVAHGEAMRAETRRFLDYAGCGEICLADHLPSGTQDLFGGS